MSVELVGLAYDQQQTDAIWSRMALKDVYDLILLDDFRRRVDLRSLLYHKGQLELLEAIEAFLTQGHGNWTIVEALAARFRAGIEDFPTEGGELSLDFKLIRHFSSLAMVNDFLVADPFLRTLLKKVGFLRDEAAWSLLETRDYEGISNALHEVRMSDIMEARGTPGAEEENVSYEHLVRNYIEFLGYTQNNGLTPFFYNSESDFRRWGDLVERKNRRSELVVDLSLRFDALSKPKEAKKNPGKASSIDVQLRMKRKREAMSLLDGLRDSDPLIRQKSAESLGMLAVPETLPQLIEGLRDEEPEVRQEIVRALAATGGEQAEEALLDVIEKDEVLSVQLIAAHQLQRRGSMDVISRLLDGVESGKPHFGMLVANHAGVDRDSAAKLRLKTLARHENVGVRRQVGMILGQLPSNGQIPLLEEMTEDPDEQVQINALYALWKLHADCVKEKAAKLKTSDSEKIAQAGNIVSAWVEQSIS